MRQVTKVFWIALAVCLVFVGWGAAFPDRLSDVMSGLQSFFLESFGWFYQLCATLFLLFAVFLVFSRYGKIKLGQPEDVPDFNRLTWFALLFSAGMGIGLLFFGVSEPISHFASPPLGEAKTDEAAKLALRYTYLHWGFHAWAIYATIALALAYFKFRKGYPGLMSAALIPLFGERTKGVTGTTIDTIAVFATIFGVAASLGLGAAQINGGLSYLTGIPNNFGIQLAIIAVVTVLFILSAGTGLKRGITYLSNINMALAAILFFTVLFVGPTVFLLNLYITTLGEYIQNLPSMGLRLAPFNPERAAWVQSWTIFYWAWWIAWAPFVGTFIARVSKGRTVREFVVAVTVIPTLVCTVWFAVFGGTALDLEYRLGVPISDQALETAVFAVFEHLPLQGVLVIVTLILISTFFITSADSATFVLGMQTTNGSLNPPTSVKTIWGLLLSASAVVLTMSGGLEAMQTAIIVAAFPLSFVLILMVVAMLKAFNGELRPASGKGRGAAPFEEREGGRLPFPGRKQKAK
ncbi:BCCT family transporter [Paenibacillus sp.]|uniref:glycine betaine uptake BCCT transporter n=1 Tax=Paenibacillus sp. TaxID=58172 RepID=UPI0028118A4F|nr:BCCT family transporter [Paenibacillus sp.]